MTVRNEARFESVPQIEWSVAKREIQYVKQRTGSQTCKGHQPRTNEAPDGDASFLCLMTINARFTRQSTSNVSRAVRSARPASGRANASTRIAKTPIAVARIGVSGAPVPHAKRLDRAEIRRRQAGRRYLARASRPNRQVSKSLNM
jgi:hypothetical protein